MLNEREQAAHDPTIAETAQGLSLAFEKLKADISQSRAARFVLAVLEKLKGAIQMEKTLKTGKIGQFGAESRITYGGVKWVVLDARPNMSLCLAEDVLKDENGEVRYMAFDTDNKNDFAASSVRAFLNGDFLEELAGAGADKEAFVPIVLDLTSDDGLDDYGTDSAKIGLITDQMYRAFRKIIPKASEDYWTCTPFSTERNGYKSFVRYVLTSGALDGNSAYYGSGGVRPLCALKSDILVYAFTQFFMPANRVERATAIDGVPYDIFVQKGVVTLSGENYVDYKDVYNWFVMLKEKYEIYVLKVGYDRYSAQYLIDDMAAYGFHMDDVFQGENLAGVIREFEGILLDGNFKIPDNSLLKSHFLNVALKHNMETRKFRPVKIEQRARIDGFVSVIDAMTVRQKYYNEIGVMLKNAG